MIVLETLVRRLPARIYKMILSRRVALVYFCVIIYFHETYIIFMCFIEQKYVWYYDIIITY